MTAVTITFSPRPKIELLGIYFRLSGSATARHARRGNFVISEDINGNFQWTNGVKALSLLLAKIALARACGLSLTTVFIEGELHSLAASLDYSLSKNPLWLNDMFGSDIHGRPIARRLFRRQNPERKLAGPVKIAPQISIWESAKIEVRFSNQEKSLNAEEISEIVTHLDCRYCEKVEPNSNPNSEPKKLISLTEQFKRLCCIEVRSVLANSGLFSHASLAANNVRLQQADYIKFSGVDPGVLTEFENGLPPGHLLGVITNHSEIAK